MAKVAGGRGAARGRRGRGRPVLGFTLIELMIAIAIIAVLAAIGFPAYQESVRKGKRGQVKAELLAIAQRAERIRTQTNSYGTFALDSGETTSPSGASTGTANYTIQRDLINSGAGFTLTATPVNVQARDTRCGTLTLNHAGAKTKSGTAAVAECW